MTIREECVSHALFLCMMHGISIPYTVISSAARNLFRPLFPTTPSLSLLGEAPSPPFLRYGVSHFSLPNTRPLAANEKDPSASLGMTIREECVSHALFLCMMHGISIPYTVISSAARNLFRPLFPSSFAKPFTGSTAPTFSRYGVSRFSLSDTRPLTANEKDRGLRSGWRYGKNAFPTHSLYDARGIHSPHDHFERSEKW